MLPFIPQITMVLVTSQGDTSQATDQQKLVSLNGDVLFTKDILRAVVPV